MEKKRIKTKRAEMTSTTIVTIILLIAGFTIVLFFYFRLTWTGDVDRETCHTSVIMRATAAQIPGAKTLVPLTCKTEKVCVGKECESMKTEKGITRAKLDTQTEIEKLISQEIVDCWSMMGEGKVSLFSSGVAEAYGLGSVYPTCVICSRIAFDENLKLNEGTLEEVNPFKYMATHKVPDKEISYYEFLSREKAEFSIENGDLIKDGKTLEVLQKELEDKLTPGYFEQFNNGIKLDFEEICKEKATSDETIDIQECVAELNELTNMVEEVKGENKDIGILFMQISTTGHFDSLKNLAYTTAIGGTAGHFMSFGATTSLVSKIPTKIKLIVVAATILFQQGTVLYNKDVTAGYCGDISVGNEAREGCSVVRTVPYDLENLKKYCSVIESIP